MTYLTVRTTELVHETVDGEVVIVDLANGMYFSTDGVGTALWEQLAETSCLDWLTKWSEAAYPNQEGVRDDVAAFVEQLKRHNLVEAAETGSEPAPYLPSTAVAYKPPHLDAFNDMESLLLLDPIHDVEPTKGWPNV